MSRWIALVAAVALLPAPALAAQPAKKAPTCQVSKAPVRDSKRPESCRRTPVIPPVADPTPLFLASTNASGVTISDLA